jgi:prolyl oligopeptidase
MIRAAFLSVVMSSLALGEMPHYPAAEKADVMDDYHGTKVSDPYRWLEDLDSPQTVAWLKAENVITSNYLEKLPSRTSFKETLTKYWNFERYTPPFWRGGRYIFRKNDGLQNQSVIYTVRNLTDTPTVVIDPNKLAADGTIAINDLELSENGALLAYGSSSSGSDWTELRVRDLDSGKDLPDTVKWVKFSEASWTKDNQGFFYARFPAPTGDRDRTFSQLQDQKLYYHHLGDPQEKDTLIYERPDQPKWTFGQAVSQNGRYLVMTIYEAAADKNKLYFKDLREPQHPDIQSPLVPLVDNFESIYSPIGVIGTQLYVLTDQGAPRYRVLRTDLSQAEHPVWTEVVAETSNLLKEAEIAGGKLVLNYLADAKSELRVASLEGQIQREITLPTIGTVSALSGDQNRSELFYSFTSFLYPPTVYRYDVQSGEAGVFRKPTLSFSPENFETTQVFFHSKDGTRVPMFVVKNRNTKLDGQNSVYLTAYGGFNISITPSFSISALCWLEKGGVFAVPNLRGGGEYGRTWHEDGIKEHKQNVFDDFLAAAETMVQEKYTEPGKIGIIGGSNGGLLIGAALTQRPALFGAAVAQVGVLDMLRYHKFTIGWAWASDYGTSDDPESFNYLFRYSPLHNVRSGTCYPPTLITTADHDDRVFPAHSFKFAATLQADQGCSNPILIRVDTKAGHGAGKPLAKVIEEQADVLSFLWDNLARKTSNAGLNCGYSGG